MFCFKSFKDGDNAAGMDLTFLGVHRWLGRESVLDPMSIREIGWL